MKTFIIGILAGLLIASVTGARFAQVLAVFLIVFGFFYAVFRANREQDEDQAEQRDRRQRNADDRAQEQAEMERLFNEAWQTLYDPKTTSAQKYQAVITLGGIAEMGYAPACYLTGSLLLKGNPSAQVNPDVRRGLHYLEQAANQGILDAQHTLAEYLSEPTHSEFDILRAVNYWQTASQNTTPQHLLLQDHGRAEAMYRLACIYRDGLGMSADAIQAQLWLEQAINTDALRVKALMNADMAKAHPEPTPTPTDEIPIVSDKVAENALSPSRP